MKRWIVKQFVQYYEIMDRPVPGWIRRRLPQEAFKELESVEQNLTRALSAPRPDRARMPDDLKERIEDAGRETEPIPMPAEQPFPSLSWALAAAALLVLGTVLVFRPPASWNGQSADQSPLLVEQPVAPVVEPDEDRPAPEGLPVDALSEDFILNPLASEKERLAADVTNALQYVAESFLPSVYALPVNEGLRSAEKRLVKSI